MATIHAALPSPPGAKALFYRISMGKRGASGKNVVVLRTFLRHNLS
jgi:hypothetical protein